MRLNDVNLLVTKIASRKKDASPALKSVHLTSQFTECTDGIRLARISVPAQQDLEAEGTINATLDCMIAAEALNTVPGVEIITLSEDDGHVTFDTGLVTVRGKKEEGVFPDIGRLLAALEGTTPEYTVIINPKLLVGLCRMAQAFGPDMTMIFRGAGQPIQIDAGSEAQSLCALLMPKHLEQEGSKDAVGENAPPAMKRKKTYRLDKTKKRG